MPLRYLGRCSPHQELSAYNIKAAASSEEYLDAVVGVYEVFFMSLPKFASYVDALNVCPTLQHLVVDAYATYVEQSLRCIKAFGRGRFSK